MINLILRLSFWQGFIVIKVQECAITKAPGVIKGIVHPKLKIQNYLILRPIL